MRKLVFLDNNIFNYFYDNPEKYNKDHVINGLKNKKLRIICSEDLIGEIVATKKYDKQKTEAMLNILDGFNPKVIQDYRLLMEEELKYYLGINKKIELYYPDPENSVLKSLMNDPSKLDEYYNLIIERKKQVAESIKNGVERDKENLKEIWENNDISKKDNLAVLKEHERKRTLEDLSFQHIKNYILEKGIKVKNLRRKVKKINNAINSNDKSPIRNYGRLIIHQQTFYFYALKITKESLINDIYHTYYSSFCDYYVSENNIDSEHMQDLLEYCSRTRWTTYKQFENMLAE